jgi:hypothetical protein
MVAGYIDRIVLEPWSAADWARFPNAIKVEIVKKASTNAGHVLDVEPGDATSAQAPGWAAMRRRAGVEPTIYCNLSTWPSVRAEFQRQAVAPPSYWIARYDRLAFIPGDWQALGCVAKQYAGDVAPGIDISCVLDYWPGVDPAPSNGGGGTPAALTSGAIIMDPITFPASPTTTSKRIRVLTGSATTGIIVRPGKDPVWIGNVYAWGSDRVGVGHNPQNTPGYDDSIESDRLIPLGGALWCDVEYSCNSDFTVQPVG